ncbi:MAG TPA: flagellar basal-body MS-ring/collar protein FliF [Longimicrobiales bacterium]|nr:flagellar basal-body MS-ring/collar protein FliF [Longimicrobiales bacterium]
MNPILDRLGGPRLTALLVGLGALAAVWGFAQWGSAPVWVPVVADLPLERVGQATQRLDESGIPYRLERGGTVVVVEESAAAQARVALAADGFGGSAARPGFELFDQPSWGMTDFTQRVNYRRALEGELERTIGRMQGVRAAQVHLAIQESSWLKQGERPTEASVVLQVDAAARADDAMVEGIQFLVANAVEGLNPENVTLLDDRGRLLSTPDGEGIGRSNRQLQVQTQVETYLQTKAEALVEQMVGPGNVTVRVAAELNFDQVDRTVQAVDPDQQVMVSEDRSEIVPGTAEQGASSVTSNTVYETARTVETVSRGGARLERLTVAVVLADRRVEDGDGQVSFEPRSAEEIRRLEGVVRNAVGFNEARGDAISVVSAPSEAPPVLAPEEAPLGVVGLVQTTRRPALALLGLALTVFLALRVLSSVQVGAPQRALVAMGGPIAISGGDDRGELAANGAAPALAAPQRQPSPRLADPQMTARVVRAWMRD